MPDLRIPIRSGVHRIAAIALYRALLTQCREVPLEVASRDELQNIVRNRFRHAQRSHSHRLLKVSFEAGYEAVDHLDAAVAGNEESKQYITSLLERAPAKIKLPPTRKEAFSKPKAKNSALENGVENAQPPRLSLFDRPIPLDQLSGKRHIPVLFNANGIPVLRLKKPQPPNLSRYIDSRIRGRQKRLDRRNALAEDRYIAALEDRWDDLIAESSHQDLSQAMKGAGYGRSKWTDSVDESIKKVDWMFEVEKKKNEIMAEKMQAVVDRETELFEKEKADRQREVRRERRKRARAHKLADQDSLLHEEKT